MVPFIIVTHILRLLQSGNLTNRDTSAWSQQICIREVNYTVCVLVTVSYAYMHMFSKSQNWWIPKISFLDKKHVRYCSLFKYVLF